MRSTFFDKRLFGAAFLTAVLACWTLLAMATSQEPGGKPPVDKKVTAKPKANNTRAARLNRYAPIPLQTKIEMARKTKEKFKNPEESAYKSFHELSGPFHK
jgi:hypothetical protein